MKQLQLKSGLVVVAVCGLLFSCVKAEKGRRAEVAEEQGLKTAAVNESVDTTFTKVGRLQGELVARDLDPDPDKARARFEFQMQLFSKQMNQPISSQKFVILGGDKKIDVVTDPNGWIFWSEDIDYEPNPTIMEFIRFERRIEGQGMYTGAYVQKIDVFPYEDTRIRKFVVDANIETLSLPTDGFENLKVPVIVEKFEAEASDFRFEVDQWLGLRMFYNYNIWVYPRLPIPTETRNWSPIKPGYYLVRLLLVGDKTVGILDSRQDESEDSLRLADDRNVSEDALAAEYLRNNDANGLEVLKLNQENYLDHHEEVVRIGLGEDRLLVRPEFELNDLFHIGKQRHLLMQVVPVDQDCSIFTMKPGSLNSVDLTQSELCIAEDVEKGSPVYVVNKAVAWTRDTGNALRVDNVPMHRLIREADDLKLRIAQAEKVLKEKDLFPMEKWAEVAKLRVLDLEKNPNSVQGFVDDLNETASVLNNVQRKYVDAMYSMANILNTVVTDKDPSPGELEETPWVIGSDSFPLIDRFHKASLLLTKYKFNNKGVGGAVTVDDIDEIVGSDFGVYPYYNSPANMARVGEDVARKVYNLSHLMCGFWMLKAWGTKDYFDDMSKYGLEAGAPPFSYTLTGRYSNGVQDISGIKDDSMDGWLTNRRFAPNNPLAVYPEGEHDRWNPQLFLDRTYFLGTWNKYASYSSVGLGPANLLRVHQSAVIRDARLRNHPYLNCLKDPFEFFKFERKVKVVDGLKSNPVWEASSRASMSVSNFFVFRQGFARNQSYENSTGFAARPGVGGFSVGYSYNEYDSFGKVSEYYRGTWIRSNHELMRMTHQFAIRPRKVKSCLMIRPNKQMLAEWGQGHTGRLYDMSLSSYGSLEDVASYMTPGLLICGKTRETNETFRERYYSFTEDMSGAQLGNPNDPRNHRLALTIRGFSELKNFEDHNPNKALACSIDKSSAKRDGVQAASFVENSEDFYQNKPIKGDCVQAIPSPELINQSNVFNLYDRLWKAAYPGVISIEPEAFGLGNSSTDAVVLGQDEMDATPNQFTVRMKRFGNYLKRLFFD